MKSRLEYVQVISLPQAQIDYSLNERYNPPAGFLNGIDLEDFVEIYLDIALIIISIALIVSVILQSKGAGLGGLTGGDTGGIFTARRGIEKTLFRITVVLSVLFAFLSIASVIVTG